MTTKKIWLAGAKGAGKSELLKALEGVSVQKWATGEYFPTMIPNQLDEGKYGDWTLDRLADYRVELQLALDRSTEMEPQGIFESSLLDNVSYAAVRLSYILNDETGTDDDQARWEIVLHATSRMVRDSELPDAVVFLPGHAEEEFYERLEEAIDAAVWEFLPDQVNKYRLVGEDPLQRAEEIATILKELNEPSPTTTEPDGED